MTGPPHGPVVGVWCDDRMRSDGPSRTAQGVALARSRLVRPAAPTGDPGADERLTATLTRDATVPVERAERDRVDRFFRYLAVRTRFFDDAVLRAADARTPQIVILGAGYDGRALRFRTPGVRFFEVDHPATQADKRARLARIDADVDDIEFVAADFTDASLDGALAGAGHRTDVRSLFVCEGVLRYLPEHWFRELLRVTADRAAPGSELAVSISVHRRDEDADTRDARREHEAKLARSGEPVLTVPDGETALAWLTGAGWLVDVPDSGIEDTRPWLLVRARH